MRLLVVTHALDQHDPILGFFHEWILGLAKRTQQLIIIADRVGVYQLPPNVEVHVLQQSSKLKLYRLWRLCFLLVKLLRRADTVLVHMSPIYAIIAGPFCRFAGKPMALWYVHGSVDWKLRFAEKIVNRIFTASKESFRLASKKVEIIGHGIDTDAFSIPKETASGYVLLTVGRITERKRLGLLLEAVAVAGGSLPLAWGFRIVGAPVTDKDLDYQKYLMEYADKLGISSHLQFAGPVFHSDLPREYQSAHLFLHASATGSIDKAVLEAMSTGLPLITSSEAFRSILPKEYIAKTTSVESFASMIVGLETHGRDMRLRNIIREKFELSDLIRKLEVRLAALSRYISYGSCFIPLKKFSNGTRARDEQQSPKEDQ